MTFTEVQLDLLTAAWTTAGAGNGIVATDDAHAAAEELAEHGWLERRTEANGDTSWWWTRAGRDGVGSRRADAVGRGPAELMLGYVDPPPPGPTGYLHPGPYGFSLEYVRVGFVIDR